jgi:hypothetical protein
MIKDAGLAQLFIGTCGMGAFPDQAADATERWLFKHSMRPWND